MLNLDVISKKIFEKRKQIGMTQDELADALYVSRQAVSKWEMGKSLPSLEVLLEMTELFDVTIDYMLDGSDLKDDDYASMFMQYPRESVIHRFLNSNHINENIKDIFYLLQPKERKQMIDRVLNRKINLDTQLLWPYMSMAERKYLLANLVSKEMDEDIKTLYDMMSTEEKMMVNIEDRHVYKATKKLKKGEKS